MTGVVVAICVAVTALYTAGAFSLRAVSRIWLRHLVERRPAGVILAERYLSRPQTLHAAAGGATALAAFTAGALAGTAGAALASSLWIVGVITALCVLGVAIPRGLARRFPTRVVPIGLPALRAADVVLAPVRVLAARTAGARLAPERDASAPEPSAHSDLEDLLREGQLEGVGEASELAIISGVVQFGEKCVGDVMTPRAQVFALDADVPARELARAVAASGYSRVPVYRGSLDQIVGVVLAFDVLQTGGEGAPTVHPVFSAAPRLACTELLTRMLRAGLQLAVVRDDAGATLGVVTLEDLLEELVGDIRDEHDEPGPAEAGTPAVDV
ncbi:hypothetical protein tb265_37780 [Gemmatimonadetes bacterium T265]|nr:hypothetical protein tb265_37780 [Gemmatimonadetes bacterium T265]